ncbi:hypothetical protein [Nocardia sp. NPDC003963]
MADTATAPAGARRSGPAPEGILQRLAYLLVALAMRRAAKQIREIKDAEARIGDGDEQALARHAERVTAARAAAEQRLRTLRFDQPREDIAAALTDALAWHDSSDVARTALDQLAGYYDSNYGLKIDPAASTVTVDPDYPATEVQATVGRAASLQREQAALAATNHLLSTTALPLVDQRQASEALTTWAADPGDPDGAELEPEAVQRRREELETQLSGVGLTDADRAQALFLVDYLTGAAPQSSLDLLDTAIYLPTPAPSGPAPQPTAATEPQPSTAGPPNPADSAGNDARSAPGSPPTGQGGQPDSGTEPPATGGDHPGPTPEPGSAPNAGSGSRKQRPPRTGARGRQDGAEPGVARGRAAAAPASGPEPVDREAVTGLLRTYLEDVRTAHRHADAIATGGTEVTDDMVLLIDGLRDQRRQLLAVAEHGHGLAPVERTQIRAVIHDIDAGKTEIPGLIWVDEATKRGIDSARHRDRGADIASSMAARVTEVLDNAQVFPSSDPVTASRLPDTLHGPLREIMASLREDSGPLQQRRTQFTTAARAFAEQLDTLPIQPSDNDAVRAFLRGDIAGERFATHPDRVVTRLTQLLDNTGVLTDPDQLPRTDAAIVATTVENLNAVVTSVAADDGNRDRLLRRYQAAVDGLGKHLLDTGVAPGTRIEVRSIIDSHARAANAHASRGRERRTRWAERSLPRPHTPGSPTDTHASTDQGVPRAAPPPGHQNTARTQRFTSSQRRTQFFRTFRAHGGARRGTRV